MKLTVGIGLIGCGTVGSAVAARLLNIGDSHALRRRTGVEHELRAIAIREAGKPRALGVDARLLTTNARAVVDDPQVDLVIECIGGTTDAAELVERALDRGRHVVTANKDLLATQGPRLQALAAARGVTLRYEAAVAGAIPIVRTLEDALAGDEILAVAGVVNGTCTSILSAMEEGGSYDEALARAQRLGYAESNPAGDVEGLDAAHKLAILIQTGFNLAVISPRIRREGITSVTQRDIGRARMLGLHVRLIAAALRTPTGAFAQVAPMLVHAGHPFAQARGPGNVVRLVARDAGTLELRGTGAGGAATASAVLGDVATVLRGIGERRDSSGHHRASAGANRFDPAIDVVPFNLTRSKELPQYCLWDDSITSAFEAGNNSASDDAYAGKATNL